MYIWKHSPASTNKHCNWENNRAKYKLQTSGKKNTTTITAGGTPRESSDKFHHCKVQLLIINVKPWKYMYSLLLILFLKLIKFIKRVKWFLTGRVVEWKWCKNIHSKNSQQKKLISSSVPVIYLFFYFFMLMVKLHKLSFFSGESHF